MIEKIRAAEQQVRDTEARYAKTIEALRPMQPRWDFDARIFRRPEHAVLGEIDGVPILEVERRMMGKNEADRVEETATYSGQEYSWLASNLSWHGYGPMKRTVRLTAEGIPHVFGIVEGDLYNPTEVGIFVPSETLAEARRRHIEEVLLDYPTVPVTFEDLKGLNLSSDFIKRTDSVIDIGVLYPKRKVRRDVWVIPVSEGTSYTDNQDLGFPEQVTDLSIHFLRSSKVSFAEFMRGKRDPKMEKIRQAIDAKAYSAIGGYWSDEYGGSEFEVPDLHDYLFRFDRVLSTREIAEVLQQLGQPLNEAHSVTLHRLSPELRELINLPLEKASPSPIVEAQVKEDFGSEERLEGWGHLSIYMY